MSHTTDNPAFPIIEFLKENIKEAEDKKDYWEENYQRPMSLHFRTMAVHRIAAFKEVLEFIEEEYKTDFPIELPSDKEIVKKFTIGNTEYPHKIEGAKWLKDKLLNYGK